MALDAVGRAERVAGGLGAEREVHGDEGFVLESKAGAWAGAGLEGLGWGQVRLGAGDGGEERDLERGEAEEIRLLVAGPVEGTGSVGALAKEGGVQASERAAGGLVVYGE